jgi:hypothetical protein
MCAARASISSALCDSQSTQTFLIELGEVHRYLESPVCTKAKKVVRLLLGWGFIFVGIVGLFLPFLQGVLFLIVGLALLSSEYVWADHLLQKIRTRFPALSVRFDEAAANAHKWTSRWFHHTQRDVSVGTTKTLP